jgi:hypothetical protein
LEEEKDPGSINPDEINVNFDVEEDEVGPEDEG